MKIGIILRSAAVVLLAAFMLTAMPELPSSPSSKPVTDIPEKTPPTLSDIRKCAPSDIDESDPFFDAVCFTLYNELITLEDGVFRPFDMMILGDAAAAVNKLGGNAATETPEKFISRGELAEMLYNTALKLGISTTVSGEGENPALLWTNEKGLFSSFAGAAPQPEIAVSRLQFASAITKFAALNSYELSGEIALSLPTREDTSVTRDNHAVIEAVIASVAEKYGAVGLQAAVIEKGNVTDTFAYGWATKDKEKMTAEHKLRVASITKVAVGAAAMLLREDGIVDLDESIGKYWGFETKNPHFPDDPVTIRTILTHTSSITNASLDTPRNYEYLKNQMQGKGFSPNKPGNIAKWSYNNHAFAVLGVTLELAAGKTLDRLMQEKLFGPMGMDAAFYPGSVKNTDLLATIYTKSGNVGLSVAKAKTWKSHKNPGETGDPYSGGLTASAFDIAKFFSMLAGDGIYEGVRLMAAESVALMETPTENTVRGGFYQALPLRYKPDLYGRDGIYFHTGSSMGMYNAATYDPETGDGVVILTTGALGSKGEAQIYKICEEINLFVYNLLN